MMILVGVGLALENGNVLLCRRSGDRELSGWWELPGGKVEGGNPSKNASDVRFMRNYRVNVW